MYKGEAEALAIIAGKKEISIEQLAAEGGLNTDSVRRIVESLRAQGFVELSQAERRVLKPLPELERYAAQGPPEVSVFRKALEGKSLSDLTEEERRIGVGWAVKKGLVAVEGGRLLPRKGEAEAQAVADSMAALAKEAAETGAVGDQVALEELVRRKLIAVHVGKATLIRYTGKAAEGLEAGFDISVKAADAPLGKAHPVSAFSSKVRRVMAELGFEEMEGSVVESAFWNFDALFQPQDHPARELADTFYLDGEIPLPDKALVERVKKAHESGWRCRWDEKEARRTVLRTHTTCLSARYLSAMKGKRPKKLFAIGRVFRNEATDYKHLAEFHQVEGIIAWEKATFRDLLGVLVEFYAKLGFRKIRFRPSYFPYTEPSLEVEVFFEPRKQWLELGGAGIFRPEVSIPLAGTYPVLAWGLSLERPLMLMLDLEDIRALYRNDLDFLRSARLEP